jgi:glycosyltransferase involved in cell wall biosynthesis
MDTPDLSLIMPCYNEEGGAGVTARRLVRAFRQAGLRLELVAVDNGSLDRTGEILDEIAAELPEVVTHRVEVNEGYGNGVLQGIPVTTGEWVGSIPADGQVDAEDVVRLFETAAATDGKVIAKVRRRFRMDGLHRTLVSIAYNGYFRMLWPRILSLDINGSPKILPRRYLLKMGLESKGWCLDPEIMVKAHMMGLRVHELNAFARQRESGASHVRATTLWEFFVTLLGMRFSRQAAEWKRELAEGAE